MQFLSGVTNKSLSNGNPDPRTQPGPDFFPTHDNGNTHPAAIQVFGIHNDGKRVAYYNNQTHIIIAIVR